MAVAAKPAQRIKGELRAPAFVRRLMETLFHLHLKAQRDLDVVAHKRASLTVSARAGQGTGGSCYADAGTLAAGTNLARGTSKFRAPAGGRSRLFSDVNCSP